MQASESMLSGFHFRQGGGGGGSENCEGNWGRQGYILLYLGAVWGYAPSGKCLIIFKPLRPFLVASETRLSVACQ